MKPVLGKEGRHPQARLSTAGDDIFSWGLIGPGAIARRFAEAIQGLPGTEIAAVFSHNPARAASFAEQSLSGERLQARVDAELGNLLTDPKIDAIYIATPHDSHGFYVRACLQAGKPVLCEKPLTPSFTETLELVKLAQVHQVFLMEAMWTVFLPLYEQVRTWLHEGLIGELRTMDSSFCFDSPYLPASRLFSLERAGGTLLDIGIYNLAITRFAMAAACGSCPEPTRMHATGILAPTGVDQRVQALLQFPGGEVSRFTCAFDQTSDNAFRIKGTKGGIAIEGNFWEATKASLVRPGHAPVYAERPWAINGFEYEIEETIRCVKAGQLQSDSMPFGETLALVRWLDELRRQMGVRYPFEPA